MIRAAAVFTLSLAILVGVGLTSPVQAQVRRSPSPTPRASINPSASPSASATESAQIATPSATVVQQIQQKQNQDITQGSGPAKSKLERFLDENPPQPLSVLNFVQHAIRRAVDQGVPANVLVLILLFPVVASIIAASRHLIGLEGFGVYTPAILAVALISTGIITGLLLFVIILLAASIGRSLFKRFHLPYLPRTALMLWLVALAVFALLIISPSILAIGINFSALSIFPILVLILLSENFIEAQLAGSQYRAIELTAETMFLAVVSALFMQTEAVQRFVILNPEVTILAVMVLDLVVGRFTGLRLAEYLRFKPILDPEE